MTLSHGKSTRAYLGRLDHGASGSPHAGSARRGVLRVEASFVIAAAAIGALVFMPLLGSLSPLVFLLAGMLLVATRIDFGLDTLLRNGLILVLPLYAVLSTFWSDYPSVSLRHSVQLLLTMAIAVLIGYRISPRQTVQILFVALSAIMAISVLFGGERIDGIALGVYQSKNDYALHISIYMLACACVFADRQSGLVLRFMALIGLLLSPALLVSAQGAGAIVTSAAALLVVPATLVARQMTMRTRRVYFGFAFVFMTALTLAGAMFGNDILEAALIYFEKDPTITGRTDLWAQGVEYIMERPLLGVGYQAFWVQGSGPAEMLWTMFGIASRSGFHFHNAHISIAVELGIVGALLSALLLVACVAGILKWAARRPSAGSAFFAALAAMTIARSMVEVDVFYQFSTPTLLLTCGLMFALRDLAHTRREKMMAEAERISPSARRAWP